MNATVYRSAPAAEAGRAIEGWSLRGLLRRIASWREAARQRQALARLSPEHLRDIGLIEDAEAVEAARASAWTPPVGWR